MRRLLRDKDTQRPTFSDAEIAMFQAEALMDWEALNPANGRSVATTFLSSGTGSKFRSVTPSAGDTLKVSALIEVRRQTDGYPLTVTDWGKVRWLQEKEGRTGMAEMCGIRQAVADSYELAIYPSGGQDIIVTTYVFSENFPLPADIFPDQVTFEEQCMCHIAAYRLAGVAGVDEAHLAEIIAFVPQRMLASYGIRRGRAKGLNDSVDERTRMMAVRTNI
jgi:hypothetical protein